MIPRDEPHLRVAGLTHPGEQREINEDNFALTSYERESDGAPVLLALISDGIGGHRAGEVASQITVDSVKEQMEEWGTGEPTELLRDAVRAAGVRVLQAAQERPELRGMGATLSIALVIRDRLHTAHVGDSRIYMLRSGQLRQLTVDHTWVQGALDHNIISAEEARDHPYAHMLQRAIGSPEPPDADFRLRYERDDDDRQAEARQALPLRAGDRILLCSDGLTDLVEDKEIRASLLEQGPEDAVQSLISLARARGGHDNITALVLAVPEGISPSQAAVGNRLLGFAGLLLLLALLLALGVVALWQLELLPWP